jgi:DNA-binding transcriptional ArsR family regulator
VVTELADRTKAELIHFFKVLSDETRFQLFDLLLAHDLCVGALAHRLEISEAAVSQHLKQLREAGLIRGEKRGYWTHYSVEKSMLNDFAAAMTGLIDASPCQEGVCSRKLNKEVDCRRERTKTCDCRRLLPDKRKGEIEEFTSKQIKECHEDREHACEKKKK